MREHADWKPPENTWSFSSSDAPNRIAKVTSKQDEGSWLVCESIEWNNISVTYLGTSYVLDVSREEFVLNHYSHRSPVAGKVLRSEQQRLYLEAEVDRGILIVYGFRLDPSNKTVHKFDKPDLAACEAENFMPPKIPWLLRAAADGWKRVQTLSSPSGQETVYTIPTPRVIVCIELICCAPRADYSPGGVVEMVRLYPRIFLRSNVKLDSASGQVHMKRLGKPTLLDPSTNAAIDHQHGATSAAGHDEMNNDMNVLFTTERNWTEPPGLLPPSLVWNNLFSYFDALPEAGAPLVMVAPHLQLRSVSVYWLATDWYRPPADPKAGYRPGLTGVNVYKPSPITKLRRQGAFDNVHIAPSMRWDTSDRPWINKIIMAPFCIHDCFHMHWRWGENFGPLEEIHLRGWDDDLPYMVSGAPMVPLNQTVKVSFTTEANPKAHNPGEPPFASITLTYEAEAKGIDPSKGWQIFVHHGCAYPYKLTRLAAKLGAAADNVFGQGTWPGSWAAYYWGLRYAKSLGEYHERLRFISAGSASENRKAMERLRDLGLETH
jgi:hypothetical protein